MKPGTFEVPYGEAWLLHLAVEAVIPLPFLAMNEQDIVEQLCHPSHRMTRDELLRTLCSLFERGDLIASRVVGEEHVPTAEQVDAALFPPPVDRYDWFSRPDAPLRYGLTAAGAARWERMAQPDWDRYCWREVHAPEVAVAEELCEEDAVVVAGSLQRLEEVLAHGRELWGMEVPADGVERDTLVPWEATYWKTLPAGHRARFSFRHAWPVTGRPSPEYRRRVSALRRWCRKPWDPAG
jgi:hypothetical protein